MSQDVETVSSILDVPKDGEFYYIEQHFYATSKYEVVKYNQQFDVYDLMYTTNGSDWSLHSVMLDGRLFSDTIEI